MKKAPDFSLPDQFGKLVSLKDFAGKWLVLYFYPKDNTPKCTAEACAFEGGREILKALGAEVVGVSKDSTKKHLNFAEKNSLNFPLLSDPSGKVIESYGAWGNKLMFGRTFMGILRNTYLINPSGQIVKIYEGVDPKVHVSELAVDLKAFAGSD
jgi:thioredoxin-dependent peroxiredoxin